MRRGRRLPRSTLEWTMPQACCCDPHWLFLQALTGVEGHVAGNPHRQTPHDAGSGSPNAVQHVIVRTVLQRRVACVAQHSGGDSSTSSGSSQGAASLRSRSHRSAHAGTALCSCLQLPNGAAPATPRTFKAPPALHPCAGPPIHVAELLMGGIDAGAARRGGKQCAGAARGQQQGCGAMQTAGQAGAR